STRPKRTAPASAAVSGRENLAIRTGLSLPGGGHGAGRILRGLWITSSGRLRAARLLPGAQQTVGDGVDDRGPGRGDDVLLDADRGPVLLAVAGLDQHARARGRAMVAFEDAYLVVDQLEPRQFWVKLAEGLAQGSVECVNRSVALPRSNDPLALGV